ncbi:DUF2989 domain-containing protein [Alteromonas sp. 1_MG-2023]|uniref:DUF2989 domain-containing protein n=1 Tax=Alteromonas sp. 1_MG-2023 TaxID=3062669 RepID=UPI0026E3C43F|nr:DUF2989 domain-containing protein [Alteromonas sp. 1_MG-2023]MDO6567650.1 DUF2989 domain-containing protein [Alteromonas sp. 1_MG-2023]
MAKLLINFKKSEKQPDRGDLFSNFPTGYKKIIIAFSMTVMLSGCSDWFEPTISEICETNSEMCLDLSLDARCRHERADIIRLRYNHAADTSDAFKYPLLLAFEEYLVCVEEAQHIEHVKRKGKEATRLKGVMTAQRELTRLARETKNSLDPYLSYYHWSRNGDKQAFHRFERYAASDNVNDPELLISLASAQIKTNSERTISTLYKALSLYKNTDNIDTAVYLSLVSLALDKENYRMAYVWLGVSEYFDENISSKRREAIGQKFNLPVDILNSVVGDIVSALENSRFDADALKLNRL